MLLPVSLWALSNGSSLRGDSSSLATLAVCSLAIGDLREMDGGLRLIVQILGAFEINWPFAVSESNLTQSVCRECLNQA